VEREHFEKTGEARPGLRSDVAPLRFVCAGTALPGHEVRVVDDDALEAGERKQGHIQFRGPSTMQGYFGNLASTREVIRDDGWVETGDLGYLADGELFVTARQKDVIIKGGRNLYPQEVEEICGEVAGVRRGCVAAFGILDSAMGTEKLVVVAETRETVPEALDEIAAGIVSRVDEQLGLPPDTVKLVRPQSVPKTSSGKIRRDACKQLYLSGGLERKPLPSWLQVSKLLLLSLLKRGRQAGQAIIQVLYGGYAWVVMSVLMITGWLLVFPLPRTRASRVSSILRFVSRVALRLTGLNPRLEGQEQLEEAKLQLNMNQQPYLLVSNHASYVDPLIVTAVCPFDVCFVSKSDAAVWPLIGTFIRKCRFLTVDREDLRQSTRVSDSIVQQLKQGVAVHVFPEATFTPAAGLRPFQMGAFKAAVEAGCPVLPVTLAGTRSVLRDGTWLPRHAALRVTVGAPLWPQGNNWRDIVRLRDAVREEFLKHCGEAPLDLVLAGPPR
jgi:1-acyl-sn-glycerol-3-phosphate acyltransferase